MNGAFYIGATGLEAGQRALDIVANNIANVNTPAFKRSQVRFSELLGAPSVGGDPSFVRADTSFGMEGVLAQASSRIFTQGDLRQTGNAQDIAIQGDGFIELLGPGGQSLLWRGGTLKVNVDGYLAAANGMPLKAMIAAPTGASSIAITPDGKVEALVGADPSPVVIGQVDIVKSKDVTGLTAAGEGLYKPASNLDLVSLSPGEEGAGVFVQGSIETSNVQLADEMVTLLLMQRAFSANAQVVQAGDQLMSIANSLKR